MKRLEIPLAAVTLGQEVTVWYEIERGFGVERGFGQGGVVTATGSGAITVTNPLGEEFAFAIGQVIDGRSFRSLEVEVPHEASECLDFGSGDCAGEVSMWHSGGMNGRSWPRCERHGEARLRRHEESIERYADSDVAPSWFDPSYAGERWNEDD